MWVARVMWKVPRIRAACEILLVTGGRGWSLYAAYFYMALKMTLKDVCRSLAGAGKDRGSSILEVRWLLCVDGRLLTPVSCCPPLL